MKHKIGLKFCGGCKPDYDRLAAVSRIKETCADTLELCPLEDCIPDSILIVCGCDTACVDTASFKGKQILYIKAEADVDRIIELYKQFE